MSFYDLLDDYVHDRPHHEDATYADDQSSLASSDHRFDPGLVIDLDEDEKITSYKTSLPHSPLSSSSRFFLVPERVSTDRPSPSRRR